MQWRQFFDSFSTAERCGVVDLVCVDERRLGLGLIQFVEVGAERELALSGLSLVKPRPNAIRAIAALGGVAIDLPQAYTHMEDKKKPEILKKFPHGKILAWEGKDGFLLFESVAIARYSKTTEEAALVDQWVHVMETEVDAFTSIIVNLVAGRISPYSKPQPCPLASYLMNRQLRGLYTLEKHISSRTFFVGEGITLADIYIAALMQRAYSYNIDTPTRAKIPNFMRHVKTVINQPAFAKVFEPTGFRDDPGDKEAKPAPAAAAPKAEKKPKPKVEEEDDDDNLIPEEPKAKNPLDDLPKSTLNLEDWKRAYSNKETRRPSGAIEWFYDNYDKEGYSLWRVGFKYPEELTQTFMSNNQIGGFFNRLEASRKYLFGSVGVLRTPNASLISGALILRGQGAIPVVNVASDWESYAYTKLDISNAADKASKPRWRGTWRSTARTSSNLVTVAAAVHIYCPADPRARCRNKRSVALSLYKPPSPLYSDDPALQLAFKPAAEQSTTLVRDHLPLSRWRNDSRKLTLHDKILFLALLLASDMHGARICSKQVQRKT
ncbi:hypothetical protein C8R44DRAFT_956162 [Mycena epipterygia]|nr:hypothetical protein C8R44DRAFT_956162 [Mycena epipterygia]